MIKKFLLSPNFILPAFLVMIGMALPFPEGAAIGKALVVLVLVSMLIASGVFFIVTGTKEASEALKTEKPIQPLKINCIYPHEKN